MGPNLNGYSPQAADLLNYGRLLGSLAIAVVPGGEA